MSPIMAMKSYLDYNATCPIRSEVIEKMTSVMHEIGNPSSVHSAGRSARGIVEDARAKVAALAGTRARDIVFCASGTEANNMVLRGCGAKSLIVSATEHDCVLAAAKASSLPLFPLPVDEAGHVNLDMLQNLLKEAPAPALVSVMLANNETGVIQPVDKIVETAKENGARVHTDAVQAAGKMLIDMPALGVDYLTLSAHKLGGPQGVGAVALTPTAPLKALIVGGGQELGRRSGTENVAGIAGFGEASLQAMAYLGKMTRIKELRDKLEAYVQKVADDKAVVAHKVERLPNTSCLLMPGVKGETQVMHFDLAGVCVSSGSACSSGKVKVSHVLGAMGYADDEASSSIRVSLGYSTTEEDIDLFISAWQKLYDRTVATKRLVDGK